MKWHRGRWEAAIFLNGGRQYIGTYATDVEAARAVDEKANQLQTNPIFNFLPDGSLNPVRKEKIRYQFLE